MNEGIDSGILNEVHKDREPGFKPGLSDFRVSFSFHYCMPLFTADLSNLKKVHNDYINVLWKRKQRESFIPRGRVTESNEK